MGIKLLPLQLHLYQQIVFNITVNNVTMGAMASQITSVLIVCSTVCSGAHQRKHIKLRVTDLGEGNPPITDGGFPSQRASNAEAYGRQ